MNILCAGEMLVDLIVRPVERVDLENETRQVEEIRMATGGDAGNNAADLAKLGHRVTYLGRLGRDPMGDFAAAEARRAGVNMDHAVRSSTAAQAKSLILVSPTGERTFLQELGTSGEFCLEDCDLSLLEDADLLQVSSAYHLPRFDGAGCAALLRAAREKGVVTSMDVTSDRTGRWENLLDPCYPLLNYFLPSIEHASMIAGTEDPPAIADFFLDRGVQNVAVKLGRRGSYFKNRHTAFYAGVYSGLRVVETTGAGDAFCAGFLTGVGEGLDPVGCVALGTACSAFVIQAVGATAGMPDLETVRGFIQSRPPLDIRRDSH